MHALEEIARGPAMAMLLTLGISREHSSTSKWSFDHHRTSALFVAQQGRGNTGCSDWPKSTLQ